MIILHSIDKFIGNGSTSLVKGLNLIEFSYVKFKLGFNKTVKLSMVNDESPYTILFSNWTVYITFENSYNNGCEKLRKTQDETTKIKNNFKYLVAFFDHQQNFTIFNFQI